MKLKDILFRIDTLPAIILLTVSLPFLCIGLSEVYQAQVMVKDFINVPGTVVGNDYISTTDPEDSAKVSWAYYPVVRFNTEQRREYYFTSGVGAYPADYAVGERVEVLYNPEDPHEAVIKAWKSLWFGPLWVTAIGLVPLLAGFGWFIWRYVQGERMMRENRERYAAL